MNSESLIYSQYYKHHGFFFKPQTSTNKTQEKMGVKQSRENRFWIVCYDQSHHGLKCFSDLAFI